MTNEIHRFPAGFLWGASTSAHQVEGDLTNNWSAWEEHHAKRLAAESSAEYRHSPVWSIIEDEAIDPPNYRSGSAVEHLKRQTEDIALMREIGLNAYRFSVEWSRIEPKRGAFDDTALTEYRAFAKRLRGAGIEPFVTLWHWTVPLWFANRGDWLHHDAPKDFARFTERVAKALGDQVQFWVTLNEPTVYAHLGYLKGEWPPQHRSWVEHERILRALQYSHQSAYRALHEHRANAQVGIAHQLSWVTPRVPAILNGPVASLADWIANWRFVNAVNRWQDFVGFNYYFHTEIGAGSSTHPHANHSDMGWDLCPEGLKQVLRNLRRYGKPIYITEHGLADLRDQHRAWYLNESLAGVSRAMTEGADVRGYFHWSLMDNFEWNRGFWPRFGLIDIDRKTQQRTLRPSARYYASVIQSNEVCI